MSATPDAEAPVFRPGLKFPEWDRVVTAAEQAEKLGCCGIDPAIHGDCADITLFAYAAVLSARRAGISVNGRVHMSQSFDLRRPVRLGEPLHVRGEVETVTPERRGAIEESRFDFIAADGSVPLSTRRRSLVLDPKVGAERKAAGGAPRPAESDPRAGMTLLARHTLVPEKTAAYSIEADNLIHSDPETARRFGFRAPVAAGLMAIHFMLAALCRPKSPTRLRMTVRFRRPMFWDDRLEVWARQDGGAISALAVINAEGKVTSDCRIDEIGYGAGR
jgi:acyl dehydratase